MNNKKASSIWRYITAIFVIVSLVATGIVLYQVRQVPDNYEKVQKEQIAAVKKEVQDGITSGDYEQITSKANDEAFEVIISKENSNKKTDTVYSTLPNEKISTIKEQINKKAVKYEEIYYVGSDQDKYEVWLLVYNVMDAHHFDNAINVIGKGTVTIILLIIILIVILYAKFLSPLQSLNSNINKLKDFRLDELGKTRGKSEYNDLNKDIVVFGKELENFIYETGHQHSDLENKLQVQNERLLYQNRLVASLTHNLKSPIITARHLVKDDGKANENLIEKKLDDVIEEINDISKIVYQDPSKQLLGKSQFDLVALLEEIVESFDYRFKEKDFNVELDVDPKVILDDYKLQYKQLIHNALSNVCNYAKKGSFVSMSCYVENNKLVLSFYNDADHMAQDQIDNIFKLYYRISNDKDGLGTGLFTIKRISDELNGNITFENFEEGIKLEFTKNL